LFLKIDITSFKEDYQKKLLNMFREKVQDASLNQKYLALGSLINDYMSKNWYETEQFYRNNKVKQVYYFSLEFLIGRLMDCNMINLGIKEICEKGLKELGVSLKSLEEIEPDAGLGNGGLGRLAACFLDSMASLEIPGYGIGIRYKYGLFEQEIANGYQIETPDNWLNIQNIWETRHDDEACIVKFGGNCVLSSHNGKIYVNHTDYEPILAVPYDMPVPGYDNNTVNKLRLWSAETSGVGFDFTAFSKGDYEKAIEGQYSVSAITNLLYPDDSTERGKLLRLKQEYFFTSAGIQNIVNQYKKKQLSMYDFNEYVAIHINDTHPALAIAELMRILVDEENIDWDIAWSITVKTMAYTNHTILAEALEKWKVSMMKCLLPRIYMIIEEINRRFCSDVSRKYNGNWQKINAMSIIQDGVVKMAYLAIVGSHSVNGVAKLHTDILKNQELSDFNEFYPGKFNNKTNGITHRRWLIKANPDLTKMLDETIGTEWKKSPLELSQLKSFSENEEVLQKIEKVKQINKQRLADYIKEHFSIELNTESIFDIQVKRLHMYKRQLLNILHIMDLYNRICDNPNEDITPRTFIFGAKAFPGYHLAKNTIKLINTVAERINNDKKINGLIKIVFIPNYGVSLAEIMIPAGDISEQISVASKEASGTGNMKFMMNGAITVATMDGANVEIHQEVGDDNIVIFGMSAPEVISLYQKKTYNSCDLISSDKRLCRIINQLKDGYFKIAAPDEFKMIINHLTQENDPYFTLLDFDSYVKAQNRINLLFKDKKSWNKMALMNIASSGVFSSDNTVANYSNEIWGIKSGRK